MEPSPLTSVVSSVIWPRPRTTSPVAADGVTLTWTAPEEPSSIVTSVPDTVVSMHSSPVPVMVIGTSISVPVAVPVTVSVAAPIGLHGGSVTSTDAVPASSLLLALPGALSVVVTGNEPSVEVAQLDRDLGVAEVQRVGHRQRREVEGDVVADRVARRGTGRELDAHGLLLVVDRERGVALGGVGELAEVVDLGLQVRLAGVLLARYRR